MKINPSHNLQSSARCRSRLNREFQETQGADFFTSQQSEPSPEDGTDMGNFRGKSVLFGVSMEALSSGVDEALSLREDEDPQKLSKTRSLLNIFRPRIEFSEGEVSANTTGDTIDTATTVIVEKQAAQFRLDSSGRRQLRVERDGLEHWLPAEAFQNVGGKDGAHYLPTYSNSPLTAAVGGGAKTLLTFGPVAALSTSASGFVAHKFGDKSLTKFALGAGVGAALFATTNAIFKNPFSLGASLLLGASAGMIGVHAGEGKAALRDASYSGGLASFAALPVSGDPLLGLHSAAASGLGARAKSLEVKALISGVTGATLGAAHAVLTGQSTGLMAGVAAATAVAGSLAGPSLMQASRNVSHSSGEVIGKVLEKAPDPVLKVVGTVPFAAGMGFLGAAAGLIIPGAGAIGATFGTLSGVALGARKTSEKLEASRTDRGADPNLP